MEANLDGVGGDALRSLYDFRGVALETNCEDLDLARATRDCFSLMRIQKAETETSRPKLSMSVRRTQGPVDVRASNLVAIHERGTQLFYDDGEVTLAQGESIGRVNLLQRTAVLAVHKNDSSIRSSEFFDLVLLTFLVLLRSAGRHSLHCGAVVAPSDSCFLICGTSGSGKSTLTLHLAVAGWGYLSDDVQVLFDQDGQIVAQPLSRYFRLDPNVVRRIRLDGDAIGAAGVDGKILIGQDRALGKGFCREASPDVLLFPRIVDAESSELEPLSGSEATIRLLTHFSVFGFSARHTEEDLALIRNLVRQCRAYEMRSGRDVWANPPAAAELLSEL
jgi:hypothetical protein